MSPSGVGGPTDSNGAQGMCLADGRYVISGDVDDVARHVDAQPASIEKARELIALGQALLRDQRPMQAGARFGGARQLLVQLSDEDPNLENYKEQISVRVQLAGALLLVGERDSAQTMFREIADGWLEFTRGIQGDLLTMITEKQPNIDIVLQEFQRVASACIQAGDFEAAKDALNLAITGASEAGEMRGLMSVLTMQLDLMRSMGDTNEVGIIQTRISKIQALLTLEEGVEEGGEFSEVARTSLEWSEIGNAKRLHLKEYDRLVDEGRPIEAATYLLAAAERMPSSADWRFYAVKEAINMFTTVEEIERAQIARQSLARLLREEGKDSDAAEVEKERSAVETLFPQFRDVLAGRYSFLAFFRNFRDALGGVPLKWGLENIISPRMTRGLFAAIGDMEFNVQGFRRPVGERRGRGAREDREVPFRDFKKGK